MKKVIGILDFIENIIISLCAALLCGIIAIIMYQIFARAVSISTSGTEELARYCYVLFVFLLWPIAANRGQDLRITVCFDLLGRRLRTILMGIFNLFMAGFSVMFCYSIYLNIQNSIKNQTVLPSNVWLQLSLIQMIVMAGLVLTLVANLVRALRLFAGEAQVYTQKEENEREMASEALKIASETKGGDGS